MPADYIDYFRHIFTFQLLTPDIDYFAITAATLRHWLMPFRLISPAIIADIFTPFSLALSLTPAFDI